MRLRAVIVDDEPPARDLLAGLLAAIADPAVEVVAQCGDGFAAVKACHELQPDILLLDIQMPKLDGFEVLELLAQGGGRLPAVVFVTAHDQHALRAFEVHAVDYVLKPFNQARLEGALRHALQRQGPAPAAAAALAAAGQSSTGRRIAVRDGARVTLIPVAQLDFAEAQDDYVALTAQGKVHLKQQTLASLEAELDPGEFVRIHRSWLVRLERVARIEPTGRDSFEVVLDTALGGRRLPLSRSGYARLRQRLGG